MYIANPAYDVVFKYMMEDNNVAKTLISAIIGEEIIDLNFIPSEYTQASVPIEKQVVTVCHFNFRAKIKVSDGEKTVIIELQKAAFDTDIMRFKRYRDDNYINWDNNFYADTEKLKPLQIYAVFIITYPIGLIKIPVLAVNQRVIDVSNGEEYTEKNEFIESLHHRSWIIQIKAIASRRRNELEKVLSIFDQHKRIFEGHVLNIQEEDFLQEKHSEIIHRLHKAHDTPAIREQMTVEDFFLEEFKIRERMLANALAEKDEAIAKLNEANAKLDETSDKRDEAIVKKDEAIAKNNDQNNRFFCNQVLKVNEDDFRQKENSEIILCLHKAYNTPAIREQMTMEDNILKAFEIREQLLAHTLAEKDEAIVKLNEANAKLNETSAKKEDTFVKLKGAIIAELDEKIAKNEGAIAKKKEALAKNEEAIAIKDEANLLFELADILTQLSDALAEQAKRTTNKDKASAKNEEAIAKLNEASAKKKEAIAKKKEAIALSKQANALSEQADKIVKPERLLN
jgi:hypothetical protein